MSATSTSRTAAPAKRLISEPFFDIEDRVPSELALRPRRNSRCRAQLVHDAVLPARGVRDADVAAVLDQQVGKAEPFALREQRHQVALDLVGVVLVAETQTPC